VGEGLFIAVYSTNRPHHRCRGTREKGEFRKFREDKGGFLDLVERKIFTEDLMIFRLTGWRIFRLSRLEDF
jgi:hypothetical protein